MRAATLKEIYEIAMNSKYNLWDEANYYDRDVKLYLHWSAGRYNTRFEDYHINITGDGVLYISTEDFSDILDHTWRRNSGSIGISLCCAYNATSDDLGDYPPTGIQIEQMSRVGCVLADALDLSIDLKRILTHGEAADNEDGEDIHEDYGPTTTCERWDLEYLGTDESPEFNPWGDQEKRGGSVLRGKMAWYRNTNLTERILKGEEI